jgi:menaquinone-9 beta-reductase
MQPSPLPIHCDVLVVGAGPSGSACARQLAQAGFDVVLVDQHNFPRDKVCGDGLIPDTHAALEKLGVAQEVAELAQPVDNVRVFAPHMGHLDVPGQLSVLPRKVLDHILVRAAVQAGARLCTPWRFEAPMLNGERVVGARLKGVDGAQNIHALWVVLATGAAVQSLQAAGVCERQTPSGVAIRGYVQNPAMVGRITQLEMVWHKTLPGGYGWIFPAPDGVFNIGAGLMGSHYRTDEGKSTMQDVNLRGLFDAFCKVHAPARELMATGTLQGALKGAPMRCSLMGAAYSRPGLLVTGEAVGTTYSLSGEGIGKALETGMLAAQALVHGQLQDDVGTRQRYASALRGLQPMFDAYDQGSRFNRHPWLVDLVVWRARRSPRIRARMAGVLQEKQRPGQLFTWRGLRKLMFE